jgi:hypothetical protein
MTMRTLALAVGFLAVLGCSSSNGSKPTIVSFSATPASLPADGGTVTLAWDVTGASTLSIDNGVGAVSPATTGSTTALVTAATTFTLSATDSSGTTTETAAVCVTSGPVTAVTTTPATFDVCNAPFTSSISLTNGSCDTVNVTGVTLATPAGTECEANADYTLSASVPPGATAVVFNLTNGVVACCATQPCSVSCTETNPNWVLSTSIGDVNAPGNTWSIDLTDCDQPCT